MFLVSFPYALSQGGYWTLLAITVIAAVCIYTSRILVDCLYEEDEGGQRIRVRSSYVDIAKRVWGPKLGLVLLSAAQIIELSMTCILYILVSGQLLYGCFRSCGASLVTCIVVSSLSLLPCAFLQSIQRVSSLSFWCTVAHLIINVVMIVYCLTRISKWHWDQMPLDINIFEFPVVLGIVIFSYTSQIFAPSLESKMRDPARFTFMLVCTHVAAAVLKCVFAYVCFLTWGKETMEVITNNLTRPGFKIAVDIILVMKALLSYPLPYFALLEILEHEFSSTWYSFGISCRDDQNIIRPWAVVFRIAVVFVTMLFAIFLPHFSILMGLVGSFTGTMLSFVWPCHFYLQLHDRTLLWYKKLVNWVIIFTGIVICGIGMYYSGLALKHAMDGASVSLESMTFNLTHLGN